MFTFLNLNSFAILVVVSTWGIKKQSLIIALLIATFCSFLLKKHLKKVIVFQFIMALLVAPKLIPDVYNQFFTKDEWKHLPDNIVEAKFKRTPNIYVVQPDGYVSQKTLENGLYKSRSGLYGWLEENNFKVYHDFRSNYPSTLVANASFFSMKHHYFGETLFPSLEMPRAREIINGNNSVIKILQNNGYKSYFIVEDEYLQQNFAKSYYNYQNISRNEIPVFSSGQNVKKDVHQDLENVLNITSNQENPNFVFIEKLIPHHVHFEDTIEAEREDYLEKINKANIWIKKTVSLINKKDPNAIILIAADHGGWVGMGNYDSFHSTNNNLLVNSIFSGLCAIKWSEIDGSNYDSKLKSTVNIFRILFSALSEDTSYLNQLEEDDSYHLRKDKLFGLSVYKLINEKGEVIEDLREK
ncbi:sulfatase-like hydrolase/transferase [Tamlana flava]|uniref:sulfatase-like hydrolase/transferase n=1 Tax=Tamlana flava TaxID=3158572 RepID=UPI00351B9576